MAGSFGAISKPQAIAKWLVECMSDEILNPTTNTKMTLAYIAMCHQPSDKEVYTHSFKGKSLDPAAILSIAETIHGRAESDAEGLNGRQTYMLYAFYDGMNGAWTRRKPLQTNGRIINEHGDHSTEPANQEGRMAQRMRHDEGYSQILTTAMANTLQQAIGFGAVMAQRVVESEERNGVMFMKMQELLMEISMQNREEDRKRIEYERNTMLMGQAMKMAPMALNVLSGREIVPQSTADTALLEALADAIDEKTMPALAPILEKMPTAVQGLVFARLQEIVEKKKAGEKRVSEALAGTQFVNGSMGEMDTRTSNH
jgi:hypothetical protein